MENGDLNWVVPRKFVAFSGPSDNEQDEDGNHAWPPEKCSPGAAEALMV